MRALTLRSQALLLQALLPQVLLPQALLPLTLLPKAQLPQELLLWQIFSLIVTLLQIVGSTLSGLPIPSLSQATIHQRADLKIEELRY